MLAHLIPDGVDVSDFVVKQELVAEARHDIINFCIAGSDKNAASLLDLVFAFAEVVVELINKLVRLTDSSNMPLSPTVSLLLDHDATLI